MTDLSLTYPGSIQKWNGISEAGSLEPSAHGCPMSYPALFTRGLYLYALYIKDELPLQT